VGEGAPSPLSHAWGDHLSRGDLVDLRKAVNRDWPIPQAKRLAFMKLVWATFQRTENIPRHSIAVAQTVVAMSAANQRAERMATAVEPAEPSPFSQHHENREATARAVSGCAERLG